MGNVNDNNMGRLVEFAVKGIAGAAMALAFFLLVDIRASVTRTEARAIENSSRIAVLERIYDRNDVQQRELSANVNKILLCLNNGATGKPCL